MCTAATYKTKDFYFGRTLDYEFSYGEEIVVMPRRFPLDFRFLGKSEEHYAIIGMAHVADGYPMFYDAVNEKGLAMAGLNFVAIIISSLSRVILFSTTKNAPRGACFHAERCRIRDGKRRRQQRCAAARNSERSMLDVYSSNL